MKGMVKRDLIAVFKWMNSLELNMARQEGHCGKLIKAHKKGLYLPMQAPVPQYMLWQYSETIER